MDRTRFSLAVLSVLWAAQLTAAAQPAAKVASRPPVPLAPGDVLVAREGKLDKIGQNKVLMENRFVQLMIDPHRGGIIESVFHKAARRQLTHARPDSPDFPGGLLEDHNWAPYYSYARFPYTADLRTFPDRAVLVLRGKGREEMYRFTEIVKTLTLHRDRASLDVAYEYRNEPSSMTEFTYAWWIHNVLAVAGEKNTFFVPSTRGINRFPWRASPDMRPFDNWVYNTSRGWAGVLGESGAGAAVETDLRTLKCFYTWYGRHMATLEWRLVKQVVGPGKSIRTTARFLFVRGLKELAGAGEGFAGSISPSAEVAPKVESRFEARLFSDRARSADCVASVQRVAEGKPRVIGRGSAMFGPGDTKSWTWNASLGPGTYRLLLTVTGGKTRATFERPLIVGQPDVAYAQKPDVPRLADAKPDSATGKLPRHDLSFKIQTPHQKWAKPLPGGPIKAFILVDVGEQREIVELAQRLDLEVETVKVRSALSNANYRYRGDRSITNLGDAQARMLHILLKRKFDVFVIGGMSWPGHFDAAIRGAITRQVREGAGLVWIGEGGCEVLDDRGRPMLPVVRASHRQWTTFQLPRPATPDAPPAEKNLAGMMPLAIQGRLLAHPYTKTTGDVHVAARRRGARTKPLPVLVTGAYGKGRTVAAAWDNRYYGGRPTSPGRLLPTFTLHRTLRKANPSGPYWEHWYALLARVVVWAAGREAPMRLVRAQVSPDEPKRMRVETAGAAGDCKLRVSWQDEVGEEVGVTVLTHRDAVANKDGLTWTFAVPDYVPAGPAYAHLFLRDAKDRALDWGAAAFGMTGPVRLVRIDQPRPFVSHGKPVGATAVVRRQGKRTGLRLEVRAADGYGREIKRETIALPDRGEEVSVPITCPTVRALGGQLKLDLVLRDDGRVYVGRAVTFGLTRVQPARGPRLVVWGMDLGSRQAYVNALGARRARALGMDAVLDGYNRINSPAYRVTVEGGVQYHPLNVLSIRPAGYHASKQAYGETGDKKHLIRKPCLDDPKDRAELIKWLRKTCAAQLANGGALDYCLGDEMSLSHYSQYFDFCFHPSTKARFRQWLKKKYGTLVALNAEWDAKHADWNQVEPMTYKEAKSAKNPAAWGEFRTYMEVATAEFFALIQKTLSELDPRSNISLSGTQSPVAGNGMDWWLMSRAVPLWHSYNTSNMLQARRSFSPWQCDEPWYAGYWRENPGMVRDMWWCLFHNCSGVSAWYTPIFFYPDMTFTRSGEHLRDNWKELKAGIWQQVRALRIERPKVAVHYSQASIHATFLRGTPKDVHNAWEGWLRSLEDVGVPYNFVSYEQIELGELMRAGYRALILPCSVALSSKEVKAIREFVAAGNMVIADAHPGLTTETCRPVSRDSIVRLFGARRLGKAPGNAIDLRVGKAVALSRMRAIDRLALAGAKAQGTSATAGVPVFLHRRLGRGTAILLNADVSSYPTERKIGREPERHWRRWLGQTLAAAWVTPSALLRAQGDKLPHVEVVRYTDESGRPVLYGLLEALLPDAKPQRLEIELSGRESGLVYDVGAGRMVSRTPRVTTVLHPHPVRLYAVLDAPVKVKALPAAEARRGEDAIIAFAFTGCRLNQAVRCEVTDAAGRRRPEYSAVVIAPAGRGQLRIPLAVNDPKGSWRINLTHILTGLTAESRLTVR